MVIIYFVRGDNYIGVTPFAQDISNLEAFERELSGWYKFWSYDFDDCVNYLNERKIGEYLLNKVIKEKEGILPDYDNIDDLFFDNVDIWVEIGRGLQ